MHYPSLFYELCDAPLHELEACFRCGRKPSLSSLSGWIFDGWNAPKPMALLGIRKFRKAFADSDEKDRFGYNIKVTQNRLRKPWIDRMVHGEPICHGFYRVRDQTLDEQRQFTVYRNALMLDYNVARNGALNPIRILRDFLVQPESNNVDLLLGKAYLEAHATTWIPVGYFVLYRSERLL